jgi:transketolase
MRATFSSLLVQAAQKNKNIVLLTGDHGYALFDAFRKECPDQYINCGVAEQNMVGVAAGLAKAGLYPIIYGLSAFVPMRVLEQIKIDLCYEGLPALLVGDGAGVVYSHLGASHQSCEDIAILRAIPNIDIASPADKYELEYCFEALLSSTQTSYLRFGKADRGDVHTAIPQAPIGNLINLSKSTRGIAMVATGSMFCRCRKRQASVHAGLLLPSN